ncbi:MAG: LURP-one-related family protein [Lachnospira sp.]|nr:LURP-one-related family protein [Lachnospira sp.]
MRLLIKQRVFAWADTFDIYDENGAVRYTVKGEIFSFGHQLHVYDAYGNEIAGIHQKLFCFTPQFEIVIGGRLYGTIKKEFTFFKPAYDIDFNGWHVQGDFWDHDYTVYSGNMPIMQITKEWFTWGDTYVIDIANPQDELMGMVLAVAIDAAICSQDNN